MDLFTIFQKTLGLDVHSEPSANMTIGGDTSEII